MGTGYSQPLRGYKYSEVPGSDEAGAYESLYSSFSDLYLHKFESEGQLPYLSFPDSDNALTFRQALDMCSSLYVYVAPSHAIAIYSGPSTEAAIALNMSLIYGVKCFLFDPSKISIEKFVKEMRAVKLSLIICSQNDQKKLQSSFRNVVFVCGKDKLKGKTFSDKSLTDKADGCVIVAKERERSESDLLLYIPEWAERLKFSRDSVIVSLLPVDDPLAIVVQLAAIYSRSKLFFAQTLEQVAKYKPTHLFASKDILSKEADNIKERVSKRIWPARLEYALRFKWKRFCLNWGSGTSASDERSFCPVRIDLGCEIHFIFVSGILEKSVHERLMTVYGKAVVNVFIPGDWGNLGASLPCDVRFIKIGTTGGPVVPRIVIDEETKHLVGYTRGEKIKIDHLGWWDEEGSLVVK